MVKVADSCVVAENGGTQHANQLPVTASSMWADLKAKPNFFGSVHLARDGGFSEIRLLFHKRKLPYAAANIGCVILNLMFVIVPNVHALSSRTRDQVIIGADESVNSLIGRISSSIFATDKVISPEVTLAVLELVLLILYLGKTLVCFWLILFGQCEQKWHGTAELLWSVIPDLGNFSAMKCLHHVTPKVFVPKLTKEVKRTVQRGGTKFGVPLFKFFLIRAVFGLIGLEAFVIKFSLAASRTNAEEHLVNALLVVAAFLNQMLGVVDVTKVVKGRLFLFIFGGEDSFMSEKEELVAKTYLAMMAQQIWEASVDFRPRLVWFAVVCLSYGDQDFQMLVLNTHGKYKRPLVPDQDVDPIGSADDKVYKLNCP